MAEDIIKPNSQIKEDIINNSSEETFKPNELSSFSWEKIEDKPSGNVLNQINKDGIIERIDAKTIRSGQITGTTLQTSEQGARVIIGGVGDEINDILLLDDSTGGTDPITGNTASINFKRADDNTQSFKIQKRAGVNHDSENVVEFFYEKDANNSQRNYIFFGRKGDDDLNTTKTDIIQTDTNEQINFGLSNNWDSVASAALNTIQLTTTDILGYENGGTRIYFNVQQSATDNGVSDGAAMIFSVLNNGSSSVGSTKMYIDKNGVYLEEHTQTGITASTTQSQGQGALTSTINQVTTVANVNDTVTLPTAYAGMKVIVINEGAGGLRIYPASGDDLGAGTDNFMSTALVNGDMVIFYAIDDNTWRGFRTSYVT